EHRRGELVGVGKIDVRAGPEQLRGRVDDADLHLRTGNRRAASCRLARRLPVAVLTGERVPLQQQHRRAWRARFDAVALKRRGGAPNALTTPSLQDPGRTERERHSLTEVLTVAVVDRI